ncbi:hypothetical protein SAMN04489740_2584 [Arthrobacter alpinus]|uniref:Uncharacterized protein n=1 Tax=Arthrobacter alpinus TaxID=656366 RepID=A0A1H5LRZ7_9MICC|nr:hypothetical protein SAMN04489740_2584 [Arthrobacter alpinus]
MKNLNLVEIKDLTSENSCGYDYEVALVLIVKDLPVVYGLLLVCGWVWLLFENSIVCQVLLIPIYLY